MNPGTIAALAFLAVLTAGAAVLRAALKRRTGGHPAPGAGKTPVPGSAIPPARLPRDPVRQAAPAPGPRHRTGGLSHAIRVYNCGCIHLFNRDGALAGCTPCTPASLEDEIRGLLS